MTLLKTKYNYTPLDRASVEGKRLYATPDGSKVPSVTTILDKTKPQEKIEALMRWKKSVGEKKAQEIVTEAASRGTRMHKFLEDYITQGIINQPGTNPYSIQSHKMAQHIIDNGLKNVNEVCHKMAQHIIDNGLKNVNEVWGVEVPLYYPGLYAGTTDCVGVHLNEDAIMDHKQTNKPKKQEWIEDYYLQMVAYALAHNKVHGTNIRKGVVFMCVKPPEIKPLVWGDPAYQEFILAPDMFDYWEAQWWNRVEQYYREN